MRLEPRGEYEITARDLDGASMVAAIAGRATLALADDRRADRRRRRGVDRSARSRATLVARRCPARRLHRLGQPARERHGVRAAIAAAAGRAHRVRARLRGPWPVGHVADLRGGVVSDRGARLAAVRQRLAGVIHATAGPGSIVDPWGWPVHHYGRWGHHRVAWLVLDAAAGVGTGLGRLGGRGQLHRLGAARLELASGRRLLRRRTRRSSRCVGRQLVGRAAPGLRRPRADRPALHRRAPAARPGARRLRRRRGTRRAARAAGNAASRRRAVTDGRLGPVAARPRRAVRARRATGPSAPCRATGGADRAPSARHGRRGGGAALPSAIRASFETRPADLAGATAAGRRHSCRRAAARGRSKRRRPGAPMVPARRGSNRGRSTAADGAAADGRTAAGWLERPRRFAGDRAARQATGRRPADRCAGFRVGPAGGRASPFPRRRQCARTGELPRRALDAAPPRGAARRRRVGQPAASAVARVSGGTISGRSTAAAMPALPTLARHAGLAALFVVAALLGTASGVLFAYSDDLPAISALDDYEPDTITRVLGGDGTLVGEFAVERRVILRYDDIPLQMRQAVLAAEDSGFFDALRPQHHRAGARRRHQPHRDAQGRRRQHAHPAARAQAVPHRREDLGAEGRRSCCSPSRSRSATPSRRSSRSTATRCTSGTAPTASRRRPQLYFGKSAKDLALDEAAMIAGILQGNVRQSPYVNPDGGAAAPQLRARSDGRRGLHHRRGRRRGQGSSRSSRAASRHARPASRRTSSKRCASTSRPATARKAALRERPHRAHAARRPAAAHRHARARRRPAPGRQAAHGFRRAAAQRARDGRARSTAYRHERWLRPMAAGDIVPALVERVDARARRRDTRACASARLRAELTRKGFQWTRRTHASQVVTARRSRRGRNC